jgi:hypothetical protein
MDQLTPDDTRATLPAPPTFGRRSMLGKIAAGAAGAWAAPVILATPAGAQASCVMTAFHWSTVAPELNNLENAPFNQLFGSTATIDVDYDPTGLSFGSGVGLLDESTTTTDDTTSTTEEEPTTTTTTEEESTTTTEEEPTTTTTLEEESTTTTEEEPTTTTTLEEESTTTTQDPLCEPTTTTTDDTTTTAEEESTTTTEEEPTTTTTLEEESTTTTEEEPTTTTTLEEESTTTTEEEPTTTTTLEEEPTTTTVGPGTGMVGFGMEPPLGGLSNYIEMRLEATAPGQAIVLIFEWDEPISQLLFNLLDVDAGTAPVQAPAADPLVCDEDTTTTTLEDDPTTTTAEESTTTTEEEPTTTTTEEEPTTTTTTEDESTTTAVNPLNPLAGALWQDEVTVLAELDGVPVDLKPSYYTFDPNYVEFDEPVSTFRGVAEADNTSANGNVKIIFREKIDYLEIIFAAGPAVETPEPQQIGISNFFFCD